MGRIRFSFSLSATECTLLGFDNMQVPKPAHLYVPERHLPPSGKVASGSKITLRCVNGDILEIPATDNTSTVSQSPVTVLEPLKYDVRIIIGILDPSPIFTRATSEPSSILGVPLSPTQCVHHI